MNFIKVRAEILKGKLKSSSLKISKIVKKSYHMNNFYDYLFFLKFLL